MTGAHKRQPMPKYKSQARNFRSSAAWQAISAQVRTAHPLCQDPFGWHAATGRYAPSTDAHHVKRLADAPEASRDADNLMAVCKTCHAALHGSRGALMRMVDDGMPIDALNNTRGGGKKFQKKPPDRFHVLDSKMRGVFTGVGVKIKNGEIL